jgi:ribosome-associated protein
MDITIKDEFIRLGQALKLSGIAQSGIDAKVMIENGEAMVNGEVEYRRGKKLRDGDQVSAAGQSFTVHAPSDNH